MPVRGLSTSKVARLANVHPNTVRLYEATGLLQPVARGPNGYRQFTELHVAQMRLARAFLSGLWAGRAVRQSGLRVILRSASGDLPGALGLAEQHLEIVHAEQARAEAAAERMERWVESDPGESGPPYLRTGDAARKLGATIDQLRNWERNGLVEVPRDPHSGYRMYSRRELGRLNVIRLLIQTGYSVMAVLRMVTALDAGETRNLRAVLDTPRPDEDAFSAADRWLSALADQEARAHQMLAILKEMQTLH